MAGDAAVMFRRTDALARFTLVTVSDAQGLSYYSEGSLARRLSMDLDRLSQARADLIRLGLIAYEPPLYQVLSLDPPTLRELGTEDWRTRLSQLRQILDKRP